MVWDIKQIVKKTILQYVFLIRLEQKFELFPLDLLAKDINETNPPIGNGFSGITLTYNVKNKDDVDKIVELVKKAGGTIVKEPQDVFWGGYHAYFCDLDGYYWEVAWGPDFKFDENGLLSILVNLF